MCLKPRVSIRPSARANAAVERGGQSEKILLDEAGDILRDERAALLAMDDALQGLAQLYPRQSRGVELRFFGGVNMREIGSLLQAPDSTVEWDWKYALRWLEREMNIDEDSADPARS